MVAFTAPARGADGQKCTAQQHRGRVSLVSRSTPRSVCPGRSYPRRNCRALLLPRQPAPDTLMWATRTKAAPPSAKQCGPAETGVHCVIALRYWALPTSKAHFIVAGGEQAKLSPPLACHTAKTRCDKGVAPGRPLSHGDACPRLRRGGPGQEANYGFGDRRTRLSDSIGLQHPAIARRRLVFRIFGHEQVLFSARALDDQKAAADTYKLKTLAQFGNLFA